MKLVLWDWNGTLLDDVDASIVALNALLSRRGMPSIDKQGYRRIFTFPVIEYYKKLGFDFHRENFDVVAREYIAEYMISSQEAALFPGVGGVLDYLDAKGYKQSILSAMPQSYLIDQINTNGVFHYFQDIVGLKDIYATSKIDNALTFIMSRRLTMDNAFFIGDTYHDYEVAKSIGCKSILVSNGHQELDRDSMKDAKIISEIGEIRDHIL
jgi:phosphoglycolate phosphatase